MRGDAGDLRAISEVVERRLVAMGHGVRRVTDEVATARFERRPVVDGGLFYELTLAGTPCVLSVWSMGLDRAATRDEDEAMDLELLRLRSEGRHVIQALAVMGDAMVLRSDVLATRQPAQVPAEALVHELRGTLAGLWESIDVTRDLTRLAAAYRVPGADR